MIVKKIGKFTVLIAAAGFITSLYALIVHIKNLMAPGGGSFCDINTTISCSAVVGSRYGEFASIPLGAYGMAYFALLLAAAFSPKFAQITHKQLAKLELILAIGGVFVVGGLMFISYGILKMMCPTCSIVHVLVILYALLKIFEFTKAKKYEAQAALHARENSLQDSQLPQTSHDAYVKFFAVALCVALPPLIVGLLSPILVSYFGKTNTQNAGTDTSTNTSTNTSVRLPSSDVGMNSVLQKDLMSFNKSNYVGNGEDYRRGSDNAAVVVQMFSDFGCPHCKTANESLMKAQDIVGLDKVVLVYRFYPLSNECNSFVGAKGWYTYNCSLIVASRCAGQQGKFWEFKEWAFSGQDWTNQIRRENFSPQGLKAEAKNLKMNPEAFMQCIESHNEDSKIRDDIILANQLNIEGTPLIIINGVVYKGPLDTNIFVRLFEQALNK